MKPTRALYASCQPLVSPLAAIFQYFSLTLLMTQYFLVTAKKINLPEFHYWCSVMLSGVCRNRYEMDQANSVGNNRTACALLRFLTSRPSLNADECG